MHEKLLANVPIAGPRSPSHLRIIRDFLADLRSQGLAVSTVATRRPAAQACAAWMIREGVRLLLLDETIIERFLQRPPRGRPQPAPESLRHSRWTLKELLAFLRRRRLVKPRSPEPPSARERLIHRYDQYLHQVCGLTELTCRVRRHYAREFLALNFGQGRLDLQKLVPRDIARYIEERSKQMQTSTAGVLATTLRSFLKFLGLRGLADERLVAAVPRLAPAPRNPLPQPLSAAELRAFLHAFNRSHAVGRRDFAMALCLCRLGLRAQEVTSLELRDLNWQDQTLHLRSTKSRRERILPLPPEVARALAEYLRDGRPLTGSNRVFSRHRVPDRAASSTAHMVRSAMRRGFRRAGLGSRRVHQLRYTFATGLHRQGVDLKRIADLLGHQVLDTTARYARVHFEQLRQASLPWPEG